VTETERDPRVQRTRDWIVAAFHGLILRRPYDAIRVADIARGAGVGRSTFYEHFRGKDELLQRSIAVLLEVLAQAAASHPDRARIALVLAHFHQHRRAARALLQGRSGAQVARQLAALLQERVALGDGVVPPALIAAQAAGAQLALLDAWLAQSANCSPALLAEAMVRGTRALLAP
jgi:AcrR family transcriptional regulator